MPTKSPPKKRGRPRKSETTNVTTKTTPKRRGRPRKAAGAGHDSQITASGTSDTPKRRGRPLKTASSSTSSAQASKNRVTKRTAPASSKSTNEKTKVSTRKRQYTIVGGYAITLEGTWPGVKDEDDLGLDISESSTPGVYEASFDFGLLQGVMVLSADESLLEDHIQKLEDRSDEEDDSEEDLDLAWKNARSTKDGVKLMLQLQWRGIDDEKKLQSGPYDGDITFTSKTLKKFSGSITWPYVGGSVEFHGKRVTDESNGDASEWNDYDESARGARGEGSYYTHYKDSNNWGYDRWGKWGFLG